LSLLQTVYGAVMLNSVFQTTKAILTFVVSGSLLAQTKDIRSSPAITTLRVRDFRPLRVSRPRHFPYQTRPAGASLSTGLIFLIFCVFAAATALASTHV